MPSQAPGWGGDGRAELLFLLCLVGMFVCQGLLYATLTPPWQAPDEPANLGSIAGIARLGSLGPSTDGVPDALARSMIDTNFPGLVAWPIGTPLPTGGDDRASRERAWHGISSGTVSIYHVLAVPAFDLGASQGILGAMYAVRVFDIALAAVALVFTFLLAREVRSGSVVLPMLATALMAGVPQFGFITSSVNKDVLAVVGGSAALWLTARAARRGPTPKRLLGVGAVILAGAAVKPTILAMAVPLLVTSAVVARLTEPAARLRRSVGLALALCAPVALILVVGATGSSPALHHVHALTHLAPASLAQAMTQPRTWSTIVTSAWGNFGWLSAPLHVRAYEALFGIMAAGGLGLVAFAVRSGRSLLRDDPPAVAILAGLVSAVMSFVILIIAGEANGFGTQGRIAFPAIGAFCILLALGLSTLIPALMSRAGIVVTIVLASGVNLLVLLRMFPDRFRVL